MGVTNKRRTEDAEVRPELDIRN